jgi:sulfite exporter TauE/SafE
MLWTALILGLAGSFHCIGMCGPIAFVLPVSKASKGKATLQTAAYHIGRLLSYALIGLLFGLLGKGLYLAGFQQRLSILMGIVMIILILLPLKLLNKLTPIRPFTSGISQLKKALGVYLKKDSLYSLFTIGFLNGFLPCGLVYMAVVGAISMGNHVTGMVYMLLFGLGTVPMMTLAIFAGNFVKVSIRTKFQKIIPTLVVIVGILFILRGLGLGIPYISPNDAKLQIGNEPKNCVTIEKDT